MPPAQISGIHPSQSMARLGRAHLKIPSLDLEHTSPTSPHLYRHKRCSMRTITSLSPKIGRQASRSTGRSWAPRRVTPQQPVNQRQSQRRRQDQRNTATRADHKPAAATTTKLIANARSCFDHHHPPAKPETVETPRVSAPETASDLSRSVDDFGLKAA